MLKLSKKGDYYMLMPPLDIMDKIDWSNPDIPKLKGKVSRKEKETFRKFIHELKESGKVYKTKNGFGAKHY
ncbi:hypothetical protein QSJ16_00085 [Limosilactobacillus reuteri]|uniref:hypothetical protein n=1 Tax=Limosilactobacillus reuteri TaxID=1598 RepID=UPI00259BD9F3|nr:hypothetical protein [Limosilactobacillus reuteri]WJK30980.1 hypothetical protein QSJ16_00085 [Limosilactobacillus reuteri]